MSTPHEATDDDAGRIDPLLLRPLYSLGGTSAILRIPPATIHAWSYRHQSPAGEDLAPVVDPVMTTVEPVAGLSVPFIGLVEAYVLAAFTAAGLPTARLRPALPRLRAELTPHHPLASELLLSRGPQVMAVDAALATVLDDDGGSGAAPRFCAPVAAALGRIEFRDGWPGAILLDQRHPAVVLDPRLNSGRPTVTGTQVDVNEVVVRLAAGASLAEVAQRTGLDVQDLRRLRD